MEKVRKKRKTKSAINCRLLYNVYNNKSSPVRQSCRGSFNAATGCYEWKVIFLTFTSFSYFRDLIERVKLCMLHSKELMSENVGRFLNM